MQTRTLINPAMHDDGSKQKIKANRFRYNSETRTFSGEASTITGTQPVPFRFDVVGNDRIITFRLHEIVRDAEGDLLYWGYATIAVGLEDVKITIFND